MSRGVQIVRLLTAVAIAFAACTFVVVYDERAIIRFPFDHPDAEVHREKHSDGREKLVLENRPWVGKVISTYRTHAYVVPFLGLCAGSLILWRWPQRQVLLESLVSALWFVSFAWIGYTILVWQVTNIPQFHGMRFHY